MSEPNLAFVSKCFPRSHLEYRAWHDSENEKALDDCLALWAKRMDPNGGSSLGAIPYRARQAADVVHRARNLQDPKQRGVTSSSRGAGDDIFNHGTDGRQETLRRAP
jgi:hypothetical protein